MAPDFDAFDCGSEIALEFGGQLAGLLQLRALRFGVVLEAVDQRGVDDREGRTFGGWVDGLK